VRKKREEESEIDTSTEITRERERERKRGGREKHPPFEQLLIITVLFFQCFLSQ